MNEENRMESDEERSQRRKKRLEEMKREKRRAELFQKCVFPAAAVFLIIAVILTVRGCAGIREQEQNRQEQSAGTQDGGQSAGAQDGAGDGGQSAGVQDGAEAGGQSAGAQDGAGDGGQNAETQDGAGDGGQSAGVQDGAGDGGQSAGTQTGEVYGPFPTEPPQPVVYQAFSTAATVGFPEDVISEYGVLIDIAENTILAQRGAQERISPASMTKVLTVLTAADALGISGEDWETNPVLDEKFTITIEITDYSYVHDCSNVGFDVGEEVTVRDLFYGTILPSGADAAVGLAMYVAGTHEAFVELMNEKAAALGLGESTHVTNCVGLYDEEHYSTVYDIGVILKTAADNPFCRSVLSAHTYQTAATAQHEEGLLLSNWFLRRIEDRDTHGEVICAKTGYVVQSKSCAASLAADGDGREYLCVTAGSMSTWTCIADHVLLYQTWLKQEDAIE